MARSSIPLFLASAGLLSALAGCGGEPQTPPPPPEMQEETMMEGDVEMAPDSMEEQPEGTEGTDTMEGGEGGEGGEG